tara:strand:- start:2254 stop:2604 length:351 start_codon:yes stop_codon:yes gene_type:complete
MAKINKDSVIEILKECYDPEIPIDLWNLGLIYEIKINEESVNITMSLTTPGCTMGQYMADDIKQKLLDKKNIKNVNVDVVFDPPWQPEMMTDEGRKKLGFEPSKNKSENNEKKDWE